MGQILHGSATTTHAVQAAIQRSKAPLKELAAQYGLNHKTVAKWRKRAFVNDVPMGPKAPRSTVLSPEEEAIVVAFRKHTLLPLDDCLYALQATGRPRSSARQWIFEVRPPRERPTACAHSPLLRRLPSGAPASMESPVPLILRPSTSISLRGR